MPSKNFLLTGIISVAPDYSGRLQEGGYGVANAPCGWAQGNNPLTSPYYRGRICSNGPSGTAPTAASALATATGPLPGVSPTATNSSDYFRTSQPLNGVFDAGVWNFSFGMRLRSAAQPIIGQINFRLWASPDSTGATQIRELTPGYQNGSIINMTAQSVSYFSAANVTMPRIVMNEDYLFLSVEWQETTLGAATAGNSFYEGGITTANYNDASVFGDVSADGPAAHAGTIVITDVTTGEYRAIPNTAGPIYLGQFGPGSYDVRNGGATTAVVVGQSGVGASVPSGSTFNLTTNENVLNDLLSVDSGSGKTN